MGSQNLMWGLLAPWHTPYAETFMSSPSNWKNQTVCQISVSYALCSYANMYFPQAFYYMYQIMGFEGEGVKILCSNPQKALPCVNTRLLVYRMSKPVQRPESVEKFCVQTNKQTNKQKLSGNFRLYGEK